MSTKTPVTPQAFAFYEKAQTLVCNLYSRWQDEHQYENIADYAAPLEPIAEECGVKIVRMTKRPFGCEFAVDGKTFKLSVGARGYCYKRIA